MNRRQNKNAIQPLQPNCAAKRIFSVIDFQSPVTTRRVKRALKTTNCAGWLRSSVDGAVILIGPA